MSETEPTPDELEQRRAADPGEEDEPVDLGDTSVWFEDRTANPERVQDPDAGTSADPADVAEQQRPAHEPFDDEDER